MDARRQIALCGWLLLMGSGPAGFRRPGGFRQRAFPAPQEAARIVRIARRAPRQTNHSRRTGLGCRGGLGLREVEHWCPVRTCGSGSGQGPGWRGARAWRRLGSWSGGVTRLAPSLDPCPVRGCDLLGAMARSRPYAGHCGTTLSALDRRCKRRRKRSPSGPCTDRKSVKPFQGHVHCVQNESGRSAVRGAHPISTDDSSFVIGAFRAQASGQGRYGEGPSLLDMPALRRPASPYEERR